MIRRPGKCLRREPQCERARGQRPGGSLSSGTQAGPRRPLHPRRRPPWRGTGAARVAVGAGVRRARRRQRGRAREGPLCRCAWRRLEGPRRPWRVPATPQLAGNRGSAFRARADLHHLPRGAGHAPAVLGLGRRLLHHAAHPGDRQRREWPQRLPPEPPTAGPVPPRPGARTRPPTGGRQGPCNCLNPILGRGVWTSLPLLPSGAPAAPSAEAATDL